MYIIHCAYNINIHSCIYARNILFKYIYIYYIHIIIFIYIYNWLRARFRRYFLRGFLHVVICTQKSCESDSVSVCCTSKHCGWRHLKHRRGCLASLHMVAELGRGAWSRSLVAEQLVGGAEAVKREIQGERGRERERKKPHSAEARC